jgi:hypothetical protein
MMYDHNDEINRINNMDEKQILLKVRNLKYFPFMTKEQFTHVKTAISDKLKTHGYELTTACCGRYSVIKNDIQK